MSVRDELKGKSFEERFNRGLKAMGDVGIIE